MTLARGRTAFLLSLVLLQHPSLLTAAPTPPIHPEGLPFQVSDPGKELSTDSLASIAPLIILVGERSTKQLLRDIRGVVSSFSLAAGPMGLITVVSSLLRLTGIQPLRSFLGYASESRLVAAAEITRVNCGGVHGEIINEQIVRTTSTDLSQRAIATIVLHGPVQDTKDPALRQIGYCQEFADACNQLGIPPEAADLLWCMQLQCEQFTEAQCGEALEVVTKAIGWSGGGSRGAQTTGARVGGRPCGR